ncbi:cytochrome P450 [Jimgerdemannia flammicorona]|uniref:Cytochrome P450 n=1 Tax=Jimgerdemannia flammicorona TaxID=994334 RepID=A0A433D4N2_9FUNG|nr:cytochrome P450 [Jimgerdemannia flammicorona]
MAFTWASAIALPVMFLLASLTHKVIWADYNSDGTPKKPVFPRSTTVDFFFGHLFHLGDAPYKKMTEWARRLNSDIITVDLVQKQINVLSSFAAVKEILVEKSALNSTRVKTDMVEEFLTTEKTIFVKEYEESWRLLRRQVHQSVNRNKVEPFYPLIESQSKELLRLLHDASTKAKAEGNDGLRPRNFVDYFVLSSVLAVIFGKKVEEGDSLLTKILDELKEIENLQNSWWNRWSRYFAPLKYLYRLRNADKNAPVVNLRIRVARTFKTLLDEVIEANAQAEKALAEKSSQQPRRSIVSHMLSIRETDTEDKPVPHDEIVLNAMHLTHHSFTYLSTTLHTLIHELAANPQIQKRARDELLKLTGPKRLLSLRDDFTKLPYLHAVIKETLRLHPPSYLGIPHAPRTNQVISHNGSEHRLEIGTEIFINAHAIHTDPARYGDDAQEFNPDRYLPPRSPVNYSLTSSYDLYQFDVENKSIQRDHVAFGAGKRVCLGVHIAERVLVSVVATLLAGYELQQVERGKKLVTREVPNASYSWTGRTEIEGGRMRFVVRDKEALKAWFEN